MDCGASRRLFIIIIIIIIIIIRLIYIQPLVRTSGYRRFILCSTLGHVEGVNSCGGYTLMGVAKTHAG